MECYRESCRGPAHPCAYNRMTLGLYCLVCAYRINAGSIAIDFEKPMFPLLACVDVVHDAGGGQYRAGTICIRGAQTPL